MNVTGTGTAGIKLANIKNAVIRNVRAPMGIYNVTGKGLEGRGPDRWTQATRRGAATSPTL